jgi:hypothetical protein
LFIVFEIFGMTNECEYSASFPIRLADVKYIVATGEEILLQAGGAGIGEADMYYARLPLIHDWLDPRA